MTHINPEVQAYISGLELSALSQERKAVLHNLADYIQNKINKGEAINLNFICTHNSRRSQLCQIWAKVAAVHYGIESVNTFSGGTEATAFNPNAVHALVQSGFTIEKKDESSNPVYHVDIIPGYTSLECFSKVYNDPKNPSSYAAIMTCSDAEANCPFIPEAETRIAVKYEDPKKSDGTPLQVQTYAERSRQIATEMFYVFSLLTY